MHGVVGTTWHVHLWRRVAIEVVIRSMLPVEAVVIGHHGPVLVEARMLLVHVGMPARGVASSMLIILHGRSLAGSSCRLTIEYLECLFLSLRDLREQRSSQLQHVSRFCLTSVEARSSVRLVLVSSMDRGRSLRVGDLTCRSLYVTSGTKDGVLVPFFVTHIRAFG
jgi:hypothetical protein